MTGPREGGPLYHTGDETIRRGTPLHRTNWCVWTHIPTSTWGGVLKTRQLPLFKCHTMDYSVGTSHLSPCDLGALDVCMMRPPKRSRTWTTQERGCTWTRVYLRGAAATVYKVEVLERKVRYKIVFHIRVQVGHFNKYPCANLRGSVGRYGRR